VSSFSCFLLHPPGAYPGKARELAAQALKKKAHRSRLDFKKAGAFTLQAAQAFQTSSCKKYRLTLLRALYCFAQEWPSGDSPGGLAASVQVGGELKTDGRGSWHPALSP